MSAEGTRVLARSQHASTVRRRLGWIQRNQIEKVLQNPHLTDGPEGRQRIVWADGSALPAGDDAESFKDLTRGVMGAIDGWMIGVQAASPPELRSKGGVKSFRSSLYQWESTGTASQPGRLEIQTARGGAFRLEARTGSFYGFVSSGFSNGRKLTRNPGLYIVQYVPNKGAPDEQSTTRAERVGKTGLFKQGLVERSVAIRRDLGVPAPPPDESIVARLLGALRIRSDP